MIEPKYAVYPGTALKGSVYRAVENDPPVEDDFRSYAFAGRAYPAKDFFRATGVSMFTTRKGVERARRHWRLGDHIAELDMREDELVLWAKTGGYDHITVWAPPSVLLTYVVNCA